MSSHPINELMEKAMENIKKMVEVNTIVGEAVETKNGTVIIPVTKVSCGFAAGGSQCLTSDKEQTVVMEELSQETLPFGGGSGGGVSVQPVGFLVVKDDDIRFQVVDNNAILDRLLDQVPDFIGQIKSKMTDKKQATAEETPIKTTVIVEP